MKLRLFQCAECNRYLKSAHLKPKFWEEVICLICAKKARGGE